VFVNLNTLLSTWDKQVQLIVYLDDGISKGQKNALEEIFKSNEKVDSISYDSRDEAWTEFKNTFSGKSGFVTDLDFNPLPASYNLKFKDDPERIVNIRQLADLLKGQKGVESLEYGEKWISRFENFMIFLRVVILAVGGILSVGLILIISNAIKLSIYSRRDEFDLMLLLGATHRFIKTPLLLEGLVQGVIGVGLALGLVKLTHIYMKFNFQGSLESIFRGVDFQFLTQPLLWTMVLASIFIGWVGSFLSITQYLHSTDRE
jgi:cell division transport system permease protein